MAREFPEEVDAYEVVKRYIKSIDKGMLKVMSKMGISTYQSYCGAQIFDAVGLAAISSTEYLHRHRDDDRGRRPRRDRATRPCAAMRDAFGDSPVYRNALDVGGEYAYRMRGEAHAWTPQIGVAAAARGARQLRRTSTAPSPSSSTSRTSGC